MKRGEVYWADLAPRSGSEQQGRRPVIVISHNAFNESQNWRSVIVVPVSRSAAQSRHGPWAVSLPQGSGGLARASVAVLIGDAAMPFDVRKGFVFPDSL